MRRSCQISLRECLSGALSLRSQPHSRFFQTRCSCFSRPRLVDPGCSLFSQPAKRSPRILVRVNLIFWSSSVDCLIYSRRLAHVEAVFAEFKAAGKPKVVVLESRDKICGGICTDFSFGFPIDLGASWLHGACEENQVSIKCLKGLYKR